MIRIIIILISILIASKTVHVNRGFKTFVIGSLAYVGIGLVSYFILKTANLIPWEVSSSFVRWVIVIPYFTVLLSSTVLSENKPAKDGTWDNEEIIKEKRRHKLAVLSILHSNKMDNGKRKDSD